MSIVYEHTGVCDCCGDMQPDVAQVTSEFDFCMGCRKGPFCDSTNPNPDPKSTPRQCPKRAGHSGECGATVFGAKWSM